MKRRPRGGRKAGTLSVAQRKQIAALKRAGKNLNPKRGTEMERRMQQLKRAGNKKKIQATQQQKKANKAKNQNRKPANRAKQGHGAKRP